MREFQSSFDQCYAPFNLITRLSICLFKDGLFVEQRGAHAKRSTGM